VRVESGDTVDNIETIKQRRHRRFGINILPQPAVAKEVGASGLRVALCDRGRIRPVAIIHQRVGARRRRRCSSSAAERWGDRRPAPPGQAGAQR
jgi:hypothetical protein